MPVRLSRASYVFLTKSDMDPDLELLETIRRYNRTVDIIRCVHKAKYFQEVNSEVTHGLNFCTNPMLLFFVELHPQEGLKILFKECREN